MENLVLVGTGEYYSKIIYPSLQKLELEGVAKLAGTIDIVDNVMNSNHRIRKNDESLVKIIDGMGVSNPIVILGHANNMHATDAIDLVNNNYRVLVEKPYAINKDEYDELFELYCNKPHQIGFLEYYLAKKAIPLMYAAGLISEDSFMNDELVGNKEYFQNFLHKKIGKSQSIEIALLEGDGLVGELFHRGPHLSSRINGGGMLQDLGLHALSPIIALESYLSSIIEESVIIQIARCEEHMNFAKNKWHLGVEDIGETYARVNMIHENNTPLDMIIGKYNLNNTRYIKIIGEYGSINLDMNECVLSINSSDKKIPNLISPKDELSKYYPVLRSGIEELQGKKPYKFSISDVALKTQKLILELQQKTDLSSCRNSYVDGTNLLKFNS